MSIVSKILKNVGKDKTTVVMTGPLSELFAKTINEMYAKNSPVTGEKLTDRDDPEFHQPIENDWVQIGTRKFAVESQQIEEDSQMRELASQMMSEGNDPRIYVYAVDGHETNEEDVRKVALILGAIKHSAEAALIVQDMQEVDEQDPKNAVVAKAFNPSNREEQVSSYNHAIAMLAKCFNVNLYKDLNSFKQDVLE